MASRIDRLIAAFTDALADTTVTVRTGRKALAENGGLPRVTNVGLGGELKDPDMVGEGLIIDVDNGSQSRDRIIQVRAFNIQMYCHGANSEIAEQLYHNSVAAWYRVCSGSVSFSQEDWPTEQEGAADYVTHGFQISVVVTLMIPIYATSKALTIARSTGQDMTLTTGDLWGDGATYGTGHQYHTGDNLNISQTF